MMHNPITNENNSYHFFFKIITSKTYIYTYIFLRSWFRNITRNKSTQRGIPLVKPSVCVYPHKDFNNNGKRRNALRVTRVSRRVSTNLSIIVVTTFVRTKPREAAIIAPSPRTERNWNASRSIDRERNRRRYDRNYY